MAQGDEPHLERRLDRARRASDAGRILPIAGALAWAMPILWTGEGQEASTARSGLYLFAVWLALILAALVLGRLLVHPDTAEDPSRSGQTDVGE